MFQINEEENSLKILKSDEFLMKNGGAKKFFFNEIFDDKNSQEDIFKKISKPLIREVLDNGFNIRII